MSKYILCYADELGNPATTTHNSDSETLKQIISLYDNNCHLLSIKKSK